MARLLRGLTAAALGALIPPAVYLSLPDDAEAIKWINRKLAKRVEWEQRERWLSGVDRPKRIILIRHAQNHGFSHTCDCQVEGLPVCALKPEMERPLTEEGKLQALRAGVALREIVGDETVSFFVSPYKACQQTFKYISGSFGESQITFCDDPRLRNQYFGVWVHTETPGTRAKLDDEAMKVGPFYYKYPGGESAADVYDRVSNLMEGLYRKWSQPDAPDNFVIVTHNVVMQVFLMRWFHWDVDIFSKLQRFAGGQLAVMEKQPNGSYKLVSPLPYASGHAPPIGVREIAANPPKRHASSGKE